MPRIGRNFRTYEHAEEFSRRLQELCRELNLEDLDGFMIPRSEVVEARNGYRIWRRHSTRCLECGEILHLEGQDGSLGFDVARRINGDVPPLRHDRANYCDSDCAELHGARQFGRTWLHPDYCRDQLLSYSTSNDRLSRATVRNPFRIGLEVEKVDHEAKRLALSEAIRHNWIAVSDGSLPDGGFELVSPAYNLTNDTDTAKLNELCASWEILNAPADRSCGGHVNLSRRETSGPELAALFGDFVPLLYAMYPKRLRGTWCSPRKANQHRDGDDKYRAFNVKRDRVEIRLFSRVNSGEQLRWRIDFLRLFAKHGFENIAELIEQDESWLCKHLYKVYDAGETDASGTIGLVKQRFRAFRLWHLNRYDPYACPELNPIRDYVSF